MGLLGHREHEEADRQAPPAAEEEFQLEEGRVAPVRLIPTDAREDSPADETALCLSGGGYRAMLYHLGALWRLNEMGLLASLDRVSSVSGGSLAAGVLALGWKDLAFEPSTGVAQAFEQVVTSPLRTLASRTIDVPSVLLGLAGMRAVAGLVAAAYDRHLFHGAGLQDLPERPRFVINATSLQTGVLWRFTRAYMADYRVGKIRSPAVSLARAVAASSAFPPFLSPMVLRLDGAAIERMEGTDLHRVPFTRRAALTDGGVYDNIALETAWKRCRTVLVSDGGGRMGAMGRPPGFWPLQLLRVGGMVDNQVRSLRKRQLIESYKAQRSDPEAPGGRKGCYWGIWTPIGDHPVPDALPCSKEATERLARIPTRLAALPVATQERLVNWGYASCDAAVRAYHRPPSPPPPRFPHPAAGV